MEGIELEVVADATSLARVAAARVAGACHHAVASRGRFVVALAGGGTPLATYRLLAERSDLPWERTVVAWGDERFVPLDDVARNERAAREALGAVPLREDHVLGWGEIAGATLQEATAVAAAYDARLRDALGDPPTFDLVLLGLGDDAHTASLFPGGAALAQTGSTAVTRAPDGGLRLTLTALALSRAGDVLVLVSGPGKRDALARTLAATGPDGALPLTRVSATGRFVVLADEAAAPPV
jgi:6-phosphogluconolactonase